MADKIYTLEQIKKAFWKNFHKSGETWFNYLGNERDNNESTEDEWDSFKECLEEYKGEEECH